MELIELNSDSFWGVGLRRFLGLIMFCFFDLGVGDKVYLVYKNLLGYIFKVCVFFLYVCVILI